MYMTIAELGLYLGKATLLSGMFYGYFHVALKDKQSFGWNRFYLLAATVLSLCIPFLHIPLPILGSEGATHNITHLLRIVPGNGESEAPVAAEAQTTKAFPWAGVLLGAYALVVGLLLSKFFYQLIHLWMLRTRAPKRHLDDITVIQTDAPGTPFSFFHWIYWDKQILLESEQGRRIFLHELAHVRKAHSLDKILIQLCCIFSFPVFPLYFIRRELQLVHEYQADYEATGRTDIDAYASYLLEHTLGVRQYGMANAFRQHPLIRRIAMMYNFLPTMGTTSTWKRWMALPLFLGSIGLFAFSLEPATHHRPKDQTRMLTVIIDAGHGGTDAGAVSGDLKEKDMNLELVQTIARLSPAYPVHVILTRSSDSTIGVRDRVVFANARKADLFVSVHINYNATDPHAEGIQTYVSSKNEAFDSSRVLGSILQERLGEVYPAENQLRQRSEGIHVLSAPACPSALVECGYMSNAKDRAFISNPSNQEKLARQILQAISDYSKGVQLTYHVYHTKQG
jgi:N-acetylmuramoyl-L-alanine amidase